MLRPGILEASDAQALRLEARSLEGWLEAGGQDPGGLAGGLDD